MTGKRMRAGLMRGLVAVAGLVLGACSLSYYGQATNGELKVLSERKPIKTVIADPATPTDVRKKLEFVMAVRKYATTELKLPDNGSYKSYVKLNREYPVWVVYAAPEFSLKPKMWCFPFSGCVPYRGYFNEKAAQAFADKLAKQGDDVYLDGSPAYSTLGWFADPVYSSMLDWNDVALAGILFHELAHQKLYVKGDSAFNESFADTVEDVGVERYFTTHDPALLPIWRDQRGSDMATTKDVEETRAKLTAIYASNASDTQKRKEKHAAYQWLIARFLQVGKRFDITYSPGWLENLNNASFAQMTTYDRWEPAFRHLLACMNGNLPTFYKAAARLGAMSPKDRLAHLKTLAAMKGGETKTGNACKAYRKTGSDIAEQHG
ncbi:MAG: aminopeptidase [Gammaproteobacteria bacterium]